MTLIDDATRRRVKELLTVLRKIRKDEFTTIEEIDDICKLTDRDPHAMAKADLKRDIPEKLAARVVGRGVPIKLTTIQGSKGLAEDYVFITSCDDQYLAKESDAITDHEICSFLVALTRARKKVFLVSSQKKDPTFLTWIAPERIQRLASNRS
jgi:superfamily I DNA/RNA helicase